MKLTVPAFDPDVKPGDIRIFADSPTNRPLIALIAADCGLSGRRIVPVSPFATPMSDRERTVGPRVFQLWNATRASRTFTDRSWLVATLTAEETAAICAALPAARPGRLTRSSAERGPFGDIVADYEREYLLSTGTFQPLTRGVSEVPRSNGPFWISAWSAAASVALLLGGLYLFVGDGLRSVPVAASAGYRAFEEDDVGETIELAESPANSMPIEPPDTAQEEIRRATRPQHAIPAMPEPKAAVKRFEPQRLISAERMKKASMAAARAVNAPAPLSEDFVRPTRVPRVVLVAAACEPVEEPTLAYVPAEAPRAVEKTRPAAAVDARIPVASPGAVACRVTECPWNLRNRLLHVASSDAKGLTVTVSFDAAKVAAYRTISIAEEPGRIAAVYEIVPIRNLSALAPDAIGVTTRWRGPNGDNVRTETLEFTDADF